MIVRHRESRENRRISEILICILPCFVLEDDTIALEVASSRNTQFYNSDNSTVMLPALVNDTL